MNNYRMTEMTNKEAIDFLKAKVECMIRDVSGTNNDCVLRKCDECDLCYKQGTVGDQIEAIKLAICALHK